MTSQKNPWTLERLNQFLGQDEHTTLEFKSCKGFENKKDQFIDKLICEISAFLNTDGGFLIVGIDEIASKDNSKIKCAEKIYGIGREIIDAHKLSQSIYSKISPSASSLIQVYPVQVGTKGNEKLAFVIEVKPGRTAYQSSPDKVYYGRRGSETVALDDKDVRLRMVSDDKFRVELTYSSNLSIPGGWEKYEEAFVLKQNFENESRKRKNEFDQLTDSEKELRTESFIKQFQENSIKPSLFVTTPARINEAYVTINVLINNSGSAKIDKLCASFSEHNLSPVKWCSTSKLRSNKLNNQIYLEKDFTQNDGISLYPDMTLELLSFSLKVNRDRRDYELPRALDFHVYLDGGKSSSISIEIASIVKEHADEFEREAKAIESRFPEIEPSNWSR